MTQPDPAAAFVQAQRYGQTDPRAAVPLGRSGRAPGLLPDPRNPNGPTHYVPTPKRTWRDRLADWAGNQLEAERLQRHGPGFGERINDHAAVPAGRPLDGLIVWGAAAMGAVALVLAAWAVAQ